MKTVRWVAIASAFLSTPCLEADSKPPAKAEPPIKVRVHTLDEPVDLPPSIQKASTAAAATAIRKALAARKKWFVVVDSDESAEVSLGVAVYGIDMVNKTAIETTGAARDGSPTTRGTTNLVERHRVKARAVLPLATAERALVREGQGGTLAEASDALAKALEDECRSSYANLIRR